MPELPEVQTTVLGLNSRTKGLTIADVWSDYDSAFHKGKDSIKDRIYFAYFKKNTVGRKITHVSRRAKNILIHLDNRSVILVHMKMTGHLLYGDYDRKDPFNRFIHLIITFSNRKTLELSDMRKFAKVTLITEKEFEKSVHLADIGPEPLEKKFTFTVFKTQLQKRPTGRIKNVLMDQSLIAGVGNIYSDEALWRAGIHPEEAVQNIPNTLLKKLYEATITVLKKGIDFGGDSMSDYRNIDGKRGKFQAEHQAYRRTGEKCRMELDKSKKCPGIILRKVVGGRSAHFCSIHQRMLV
jgi:formamidopyrimidine-DNA glycosylase